VGTRACGKKSVNKAGKFQWKSSWKWNKYDDKENGSLLRAYLSGFPFAQMLIRGNRYEYDFKKMQQINKDSGRKRQIRPPYKLKQPTEPLVPPGPTTCVKVPKDGPGNQIMVPHPQDSSQFIAVEVPAHAKVGSVMLVPVPLLDDSEPDQKKGSKGKKKKKPQGMSGGEKIAAAVGGAAVVGGFAVAGAVIGDAAADGAFDGVGDVIADGADDAADVAADAGAVIMDAVDDIDFDDAGDFMMDLGEDAGDMIMDLF